MYIEIDTCVESGQQVLFMRLNFKVKLCLMRWTDHKNGTIMILQVVSFIAVIFIASPNFFEGYFHNIRQTHHKNGTWSKARKPRLVMQ